MVNPFSRTLFVVSLCLLCVSVCFGFQEADSNKSEDDLPQMVESMKVTANKATESDLADVPVSATIFSSRRLERENLAEVKDLQAATPGLNVAENEKLMQIFIRGVGTQNVLIGSDPSTALHLDGVYLARPLAAFADFLDVERVEVLRGPQGTIFGRNSVGGTINIVSKKPSQTVERSVRVGYGNYEHLRVKGRFSGPLVDTRLMGSFSFNLSDSEGYVENLTPGRDAPNLNNEDSFGFRGSLYYVLENCDLLVTFDRMTEDDRSAQHKPLLVGVDGTPIPDLRVIDDPFAVDIPVDPRQEHLSQGLTVRGEYRMNGMKLVSMTAYRETEADVAMDSDFTEFDDIFEDYDIVQSQWSQEFNLTGGNERFDWVAGLFYLHEEDSLDLINYLPGFVPPPSTFDAIYNTEAETDAYAVFFQGNYAVNEKTKLSAGLRYSYEEKSFFGTGDLFFDGVGIAPYLQDQSDDWDAVTPTLSLDYRLNDDAMIYGKISRGFKSGGYNPINNKEAFDPEYLWAYEVGMKAAPAGGRVQVSGAVFQYDYQDLQQQAFVEATPEFPEPSVVITNAAEADITGLELELSALVIPQMRLDVGLSLLNAEYGDYQTGVPPDTVNVSGNQMVLAPDWSYHIGLDYRRELSAGLFEFGARYAAQDRVYFTAFNNDIISQGEYGLLGADVGLVARSKKWQVHLFGENLTDEVYYSSYFDFSNTGVSLFINPPRTYGVRLGFDF